MAITATPGDSADTFISLANAETYFAKRPHSEDWSSLESINDKESLLIMATRILNDLRWVGIKNTHSSLRWPRSSVYDLDDALLPNTEIPLFLQVATCELALHLSKSDSTREAKPEELDKIAAGSIKVDFNNDVRSAPTIPQNVSRLINHYIKQSSLELVR